jgi:hypothetical protein
MPRHRALAALLILLLGVGSLHCASRPFATGATVDAEYDFSSVKTFAFAQVPSKVLASANGKILRVAIDEALTARGFQEAEEADADIWIAYDIGIFSASSVSWGKQGGPGQGRIIVRAIDPKANHEVWYGWAEANLRSQPDPERRIREAVEALFQNRVGAR